jgi:methylmalonyl-CoA mutase cobalamin-binding domain/chain
MTLAPLVVHALRDLSSSVPVVVGGIIPHEDVEQLLHNGIAAVFGPGSSVETIVATLQELTSSLH